MTPQQTYVTIAVAALVVAIAVIALATGKRWRGTALTGLALAFVLAGMLFGRSRAVGYGLLGTGVLIAVIDLARKIGARAKGQSYP